MTTYKITVDVPIGVIPTDHWIVCSGVRILSPKLLSFEEATEAAKLYVNEGHQGISMQHVGGK